MNTRHWMGIVVGSIGMALVAPAAAMPSAVVMVGAGNEGRLDGDPRLRGPGFEQSTVVTLNKGGNQYIVLVTMQSVVDSPTQNGPWQCSCSSYQLSATAPPAQISNLVPLTNYNNGERLCNHPKAATDGSNIVWMFGSDTNNNRPRTYAGVIDEQCRTVVAPLVVSTDPNSNEGAPDIAFNGVDASGASLFTGGYLNTGGNNDHVVALGLKMYPKPDGITMALDKTWLTTVVSPSNIGRPTIASGGIDRSLFCASQGNNRPPEDGISCSWLNTTTGVPLWKNIIVPSDRNKGVYMSQPTVAKLADGRYALNVVESNAMGRNTNLKGSNLAHLYAIDVVSDALTIRAETVGAAAFNTHAAICSGSYGVSGENVVGVISASPTGIGRPAMLMVKYDANAQAFGYDATADRWPIAWYGDSGHLANWYGRNPGRQGRDFLRCIGDVPNPGHGVANGYMAGVETFFVAAVAGRIPGDMKNSLTLSLVPGKTDIATTPDNPKNANDVATPSPPAGPPDQGPGASSGCACSTPGTAKDTGGLGGLALLGLGLALFASRRKA